MRLTKNNYKNGNLREEKPIAQSPVGTTGLLSEFTCYREHRTGTTSTRQATRSFKKKKSPVGPILDEAMTLVACAFFMS